MSNKLYWLIGLVLVTGLAARYFFETWRKRKMGEVFIILLKTKLAEAQKRIHAEDEMRRMITVEFYNSKQNTAPEHLAPRLHGIKYWHW